MQNTGQSSLFKKIQPNKPDKEISNKTSDAFRRNKEKGKKLAMYNTIDLFAGAGGLSLGFKQTGMFKLLAAAEIQESARETYKRNIPDDDTSFVFIENVVGYDFKKLNEDLGGIDVVIGGPPCQGFSNANRQKNHLISMNNALVKEYFRAIKEIRPIAFVMENVSMLKSSTHRFYDSYFDHDAIMAINESLTDSGAVPIPFRRDSIILSKRSFDGIDITAVLEDNNWRIRLLLPNKLYTLLNVLNKNKSNSRRLPKFLEKHSAEIIKAIDAYCLNLKDSNEAEHEIQINWLNTVKAALAQNMAIDQISELTDIIDFQKLLLAAGEINDNQLIGQYETDGNCLCYSVNSYAVIDYVNAILGQEYIQHGATLNAAWYGVPQERKRHIVIGVRKDVLKQDFSMPSEPKDHPCITVWDAISDLAAYTTSFEPDEEGIPYKENEQLSKYQKTLRTGSTAVRNHFVTNTTEEAMIRFKKLAPGENFLCLPADMKATYSKPERTQKTIYYRLLKDEPSGTVVNVRKSMWIHPTLDRALSLREAARLQSFPDSFVFAGPKNSQYQQVGNAVPPMLAEIVARHLIGIIEPK